MSKHTPGPWTAAKDNNGRPYVLSDGSIRVADCWYLPIGKEHGGEAEANAKLIAAAPEMHKWLEKLVEEDGILIAREVIAIQALLDKIDA
jgi:hypothetical protein